MGIKSAFARLVAAINAIDDKLKNISIGGRNLLRNTQNPTYYRWSDRGELSGTRLTTGATESGTSVGIFTSYQNLNLKQGQDYVISFDVDTDLANLNYNYILENNGNIRLQSINIKQGRVVIKYTPDRNLNDIRLLIGGYPGTKNNYLDVQNIKVETGSIPTDWTPALEDIGGWQLITSVTDLNILTETGNYFLQAGSNPNAPNTSYQYVTVAKANDSRIVQTARADNNVGLLYERSRINGTWSAWVKIINQNDLNSRFNATNVGGRNLILGSNVSLNQHGTTALTLSSNIDFSLVQQLTLACDIYYKNAKRSTKSDNKWWRAGVEIRIHFTDGTSQYLSNFQVVTTSPTSYNQRRLVRYSVPRGKTIKGISGAAIQIWDIDADEIVVKNPKLELYHIMTDWSPAPEDHQSQIDDLKARLMALEGKFGAISNDGGSYGN